MNTYCQMWIVFVTLILALVSKSESHCHPHLCPFETAQGGKKPGRAASSQDLRAGSNHCFQLMFFDTKGRDFIFYTFLLWENNVQTLKSTVTISLYTLIVTVMKISLFVSTGGKHGDNQRIRFLFFSVFGSLNQVFVLLSEHSCLENLAASNLMSISWCLFLLYLVCVINRINS